MTLPITHFSTTSATQLWRVEGPNVWHRDDFADPDSFSQTLTSSQVSSLMTALRAAQARGLAPRQMRRSDFHVPDVQRVFRQLAATLQSGRGFALLRGLPIDDLSDNECRLLFWGIGMQLGVPVNQSRKLEMLAEVRDVGDKIGDPTARAFRSAGPLRFHTDQCDVLALMCIRGAQEGGQSRIVSSATVHNQLLDNDPDLLELLYEPFYFSRQGEELANELPFYTCPIFAHDGGRFASLFSRTFIENAQRLAEVPSLSAEQEQALDAVAEVADANSISVELNRGDVQFFNNHTIYHARTDYRDHVDPAHKRTLLRLWLTVPDGRRLPAPMRALFGESAPGQLRGGIAHSSGQRFSFEDWRAAGWTEKDLALWQKAVED